MSKAGKSPLHVVAKKVQAALGAEAMLIYFRTSDGEAFELQTEKVPAADKPGAVITRKTADLLLGPRQPQNEVVPVNTAALTRAGLARSWRRAFCLGCTVSLGEDLEGFVLMSFSAKDKETAEVKARLQPLLTLMTGLLVQRREAFSGLQMTAMFLDAATDGVGIACPATLRTLYVNPAARRMIGIAEDEPLEKIHPYICRPGALATERERILREVELKGSWVGETMLATLQGEALPVSEMVVKFPFAGSPSGWAVGAIIRDRRRDLDQEQMLGRTKDLVEGLAEIGPQAFYVFDFQKNTMVAGEDKLAALYGYTPEEIEALPQGWGSIVHPDDLPTMQASVARLAKARPNRVIPTQLRIRRKNKKWEVVNVCLRALERDGEGRLLTAVGLSQVITNYIEPIDKLKASEALYRQMVDEAGDSIFLFDEQGTIVYANRYAERALGYRKGELKKRSLWKVFEGELPRSLAAMKPGSTHRFSCVQTGKDGRTISSDLRMRRLADKRFLGIARDLSREAELAEANQLQAAYYRGLVQNNTSGVAVFNEKQVLTATNHALVNLLKYSQKELLGRKLIDLVPDEHQTEAREVFNRMQRDRRFNRLFGKGVKLTLRRKDGKHVSVQAALSAISDGIVLFSQGIAIFTDITEEQRIRRERDEQARFTEALVNEAPVCIIVMDPEGRIMRVNPAVEELTGFSARSLVKKLIWESGIMDPDQAGASHARFQALIGGEKRVTATLRVFTKAGGTRTVEAESTAVRTPSGEVTCIVTTATDVTEQKRLEAEVIKIAEAEQMRIGHDLHDGVGQVLTGIMSLVEGLEYQLEGERQKEAARIRELVSEAVQQVRQLSHGLSPAAVKLRGLAASLRLLADRISSSQLECKCEFEIEPHLKNPEAETHVFRIAQEAVNNAMRHGRPRHITIALRPLAGEKCLMEIHDDGVGISAQPPKRGDGIGIRVMKYRASLIGGEFTIGPGREKGTTVLCSFSCGL